ncbi:MAG: DUF58 domain-containing protein [Bryobacterales bacterium]
MAIQQLLDPAVLGRLTSMELVARTVVDGVLTGLHRSPFFGFSLDFAEYRPYVQGDDPRFVDWNVFSRTERTYIKRYLGETNTHLVILLDTSASMGFKGRAPQTKLQYAKYLASSLAYLSTRQHDATGLICFDAAVNDYRHPSTRPGHLQSILHTIDQAEASKVTNLELPFDHFRQYVSKRGLVAVISDFYYDPETVVKGVRPLAFQGHEMMFFQILDPAEIQPDISEATVLEDMETGDLLEVSSDFAKREYPERMRAHMENLKKTVQGIGGDYVLLDTSRPLDLALREYLLFRQRRR